MSHDVLRALFEASGAHIWTRGGEVVHTDGRLLAVHSGPGGLVPVGLPRGVEATVVEGSEAVRTERSLTLRLGPSETAWLRLVEGKAPQ
ncbi:MAG: hypothetical protein IT185_12220 [Acidobacteria bacterium]|nr:hypothetical protein [Acidobacteriota bacterium]